MVTFHFTIKNEDFTNTNDGRMGSPCSVLTRGWLCKWGNLQQTMIEDQRATNMDNISIRFHPFNGRFCGKIWQWDKWNDLSVPLYLQGSFSRVIFRGNFITV